MSPLKKSRVGDEKEGSEDRLEEVEVPSYGVVCPENRADEEQLEEAGPLQKSGEDDKKESCEGR